MASPVRSGDVDKCGGVSRYLGSCFMRHIASDNILDALVDYLAESNLFFSGKLIILSLDKSLVTSSRKLESSNEVCVKSRESQRLKSKIKSQDRRESERERERESKI